ncbi:MAG: iron chelate uptake ABC transporter family permease subunit [Pseudomonadota bacterium]
MHTRTLLALSLLLVLSCVAYMTLGVKAGWAFILPFRGTKLVALLTVAVSISTATVLFQAITHNRILTPSIMGFDALYVLLLTGAVYGLGGFAVADLPPLLVFAVTAGIMVGASLMLFGTLLLSKGQDLIVMILTGVIFGTLFRALTSFMQRLIDPNEFSVVQVASYARFNDIETEILWPAGAVMAVALIAAWRMRYRLDVLMLGRETAINLGEQPRTRYLQVLVIIAVLVSVSTALVGPVALLGLLVVALAHVVTPTPHHAILLPSAALISAITLVGGQTVMERVLHLTTPLAVIVDVLGGMVFLFLVLRGLRA